MKWAVLAVAILIAAACSPANVVETTDSADAVASATTPTAVPTTAAAVAPAVTPTAVSVPVAPATTVPASTVPATAVPTSEPTSAGEAEQVEAVPAAPTAVPAPPTPNESAAVLVSNGAEVYTLTCARCHAENGEGVNQHPGLLGIGNHYTSAGLNAELTSGHRFTFGFADKLSADEIAAVVAYVKAAFA